MIITFSKLDYVYLAALVLAILFFVVWFSAKKARRSGIENDTLEKIRSDWRKIEALASQDTELSWKLAVMEADKILDYSLKSLGTPGKDLGERLRAASYRYPKIRQVWPAHKIRNRLVHESDYQLDRRTARFAIQQFAGALKILHIL